MWPFSNNKQQSAQERLKPVFKQHLIDSSYHVISEVVDENRPTMENINSLIDKAHQLRLLLTEDEKVNGVAIHARYKWISKKGVVQLALNN